ncbi:MAG: DUF2249 domain-containing protein [Roseateles sp.]|uniref:DUF2249 domain-containing protein n=1 Tax=Roseateles sp. TaxID=1971397 RepID=UPI004035DBF1
MQATPTHDLRQLAPPQRHQLAFQCFDKLAIGEAFELINDHEPRGLLMQFGELRTDSFDWQVVQAEPGAWRIRISRTGPGADAPAAAATRRGDCGCSCSGG